ncbi:MAG: transglycosylase domain-containing protein, partial [Lachnospiraceae bacterium]|nr:transglycosylase domain-containing protein [Lachnospiraceae bacterium]
METLIEILKAVVFGFVEGITEWLPISSTGHLILLGNFISFDLPGDAAAKASFMELYDVVIQLGAILAVVVIFIKEIWPFGIENPDKEVKRKVGDLEDHYWRILGSPLVIRKDIFMLWVKIALACIPGLAYGLLLDDLIETVTAPVMTVLWPGRSWVRKGFEVYFTTLIELLWSKQRIMEVYLNSIEMGEGIYGVESVARHHFGTTAKALSRSQCALIAATLPKPRKFSSKNPSSYVLKRQKRIM